MDTNNSTESSATLDPVDEIASLLAGGDESAETEEPEKDPPSAEEQDTDIEESEESEDAEDELSEDPTDDDDVEESEPEVEEDESLANLLGITEDQMTVDDDGNFLLNVKVDGQVSQHNMSEVIKSYQLDRNNTQKAQQLASDRQSFEQGLQERVTFINETIQRNEALADVLQNEILGEFNSTNWEELRKYDPAEYAAKRTDYAAKYQKVQRLKQDLASQSEAANQDVMTRQKQNEQQHVRAEFGKMLERNPTWNDKDTYDKDMGAIKNTLIETYGFDMGDFNQVSDSRIIEVLKDAVAFRKGSNFSKKKVIKAPKFQKKGPGKRKPKVTKLERITKAAKAASGSRKRDLQTDAVAQLLSGG